jgi:hypothetical protein
MTTHKQVRIRGYGQEANVDEGIAPLIAAMWRAGIKTWMSCQEGAHDFVWLNFSNTREAEKFLDIVGEYDPDPDSMYQRMSQNPEHENAWKYGTGVDDLALTLEFDDDEDEVIDEHHNGEPCFSFGISIWFPPSDVPEVLERLHAYCALEAPQDVA